MRAIKRTRVDIRITLAQKRTLARLARAAHMSISAYALAVLFAADKPGTPRRA